MISNAPHIVLIDDDPLLLEYAENLLHDEFPGFLIDKTDNLQELASLLDKDPVSLVVTDYHMKDVTGMDVLQFVKNRHPDCPVVMFTGSGDEQIAVEAMKAGLNDYVVKSSRHMKRLSYAVHAALQQTAERQKLKEADARIRALAEDVLDVSTVGVIVLDEQFRVAWVNKSIERFFGIGREELLGRDKRELIRSRIKHFFEDPETFAGNILKSYRQNDYEIAFDCHLLAGEGREDRWLEHRSRPIREGFWAGGRTEHYYDITDRKTFESEERRLVSLNRVNPFPIVEVNGAGSVTSCNPSADVCFPDLDRLGTAHPVVRCAMDAMDTLGKTGLPSLILEAVSGGRTYELHCWLVRGEDILRFYAFDITTKKQAEEALAEREEHMSLFIEHSPVALAMFDREMRYLAVSKRWVSDFKLDGGSIIGRSHYEVFPEIPQRWKDIHQRCLAGAVERCEEDPFIRADGRTDWIRWEVRPWRTTDGSIGGLIIFSEDITETKRSQEALQKTNERLTHLVQASPMGITVLSPDGLVQLWNPAAERIYGWREDEMLGRPLPTIPPGKEQEHRSICQQVLNGHSFTGWELIRKRKDGSLIDISLSTAALKNEQGNVVGILGVMVDITDRKQMEHKAARLEELATLGQLLGGVAHELKNPLFVLAGRLQLVSEKLAAREYDTVGADFKRIEDAAQRMTAVAQRFLSFAQPHSMQRAQCDVNVPLQKTVEFLSNELMKNHIQTAVSLGQNLPPVWCDERELHQVFTNLIMNATYAMAKANSRGTLSISTALNGTTVEIRIRDDGPGVAPEHRSKLFDPFFTTKPHDEGTGLGLWIVKTSIINMRGTINCETETGKGATFIIGIPVLPAQESS
jgi:PAS domain S-box-containing protein